MPLDCKAHKKGWPIGNESDSWQTLFTKEDFEVLPILHGLGKKSAFAEIFVDHIRDVAKDNTIDLGDKK